MRRHAFSLYQFPNERISFYHFLDRDQTVATMLQPPPSWPGYLGDLQRYLDMLGAMEGMSGEEIGVAHYLLKMIQSGTPNRIIESCKSLFSIYG